MLWTMSVILFGLWVLGLLTGGTTGAWVHLLLVFSVLCLALGVAGRLPRAAVRR